MEARKAGVLLFQQPRPRMSSIRLLSAVPKAKPGHDFAAEPIFASFLARMAMTAFKPGVTSGQREGVAAPFTLAYRGVSFVLIPGNPALVFFYLRPEMRV